MRYDYARDRGMFCYVSCTCEDTTSQVLKLDIGMRPVALKIGYRADVVRPGERGSAVAFTDAPIEVAEPRTTRSCATTCCGAPGTFPPTRSPGCSPCCCGRLRQGADRPGRVEDWLLCHSRTNDAVQVLCAGWLDDGRVTLAVGSSGAGKSTELFRNVRAGSSFFSNDRAFLRMRDGVLEVRGRHAASRGGRMKSRTSTDSVRTCPPPGGLRYPARHS